MLLIYSKGQTLPVTWTKSLAVRTVRSEATETVWCFKPDCPQVNMSQTESGRSLYKCGPRDILGVDPFFVICGFTLVCSLLLLFFVEVEVCWVVVSVLVVSVRAMFPEDYNTYARTMSHQLQ